MSNIRPDVREVIDEFAGRLLALAGGGQIPDEWKRYLSHALRKPAGSKRGAPSHPKRFEITVELLMAEDTGKRGALERAISEASNTYGIDPRTLKKWIRWPRSAKDDLLLQAMAVVIAARVRLPLCVPEAGPRRRKVIEFDRNSR